MAISNQITEADFYMTDLIFTVDRNGSDVSQSRMRPDLLAPESRRIRKLFFKILRLAWSRSAVKKNVSSSPITAVN